MGPWLAGCKSYFRGTLGAPDLTSGSGHYRVRLRMTVGMGCEWEEGVLSEWGLYVSGRRTPPVTGIAHEQSGWAPAFSDTVAETVGVDAPLWWQGEGVQPWTMRFFMCWWEWGQGSALLRDGAMDLGRMWLEAVGIWRRWEEGMMCYTYVCVCSVSSVWCVCVTWTLWYVWICYVCVSVYVCVWVLGRQS